MVPIWYQNILEDRMKGKILIKLEATLNMTKRENRVSVETEEHKYSGA